jgi:hypothetical protein
MFRSPLKPFSGGPWPYFATLLNWNVDLHFSIFNPSNTCLLSDNCIRLHVSATVGHHQAFSVTRLNYVCLYKF